MLQDSQDLAILQDCLQGVLQVLQASPFYLQVSCTRYFPLGNLTHQFPILYPYTSEFCLQHVYLSYGECTHK